MDQKEIKKRVKAINRKIQKLEDEKDKLQQMCRGNHSSTCVRCPDCYYEPPSNDNLPDIPEGPMFFQS